jgi:drug/metabolite transporter (DMT)-like permease
MPRERLRLIIAFACVYLIWGSTYLAIRIAIETIPPFLMAGARFITAGLILLAFARARGAAWPSVRDWKSAAVVGTLMLVGGNGGVVWAEQTVPSSLAALIVAAVPIVTVALEWLRPGGERPGRATILGLVTGFAGVAILVNPFAHDAARVNPAGAAALLVATVTWAAGSIYGKGRGARNPIMGSGANMLAGGIGLLLAGLLLGEAPHLQLAAISTRSAVALVYLVLVGAVVGFTAFFYVMQHTTPAKATTYAYVNPVVALILGWAILDEPLTPRILLATVVIISGVVMITALPHLRGWYVSRRAMAAAAD